jgi:hypothetical protein
VPDENASSVPMPTAEPIATTASPPFRSRGPRGPTWKRSSGPGALSRAEQNRRMG